ncbi:cinnamyl alcohol dehydrogenase [Sodiomyces alkalinus F11]|uniref:alcohol dehydrogenase (NADP(+)) n=1 Tax=Sodiomyces alkalinus (strain CBS 110278 / VKM F-3762 / F11) TaxID=1314773 RepID=A0A3N2PK02_SODAK|nr:cinnamyl alcohol dehydrogenase [Sodiomyces alkalinus F11]ROT34862.1 cinnamyl alcohol dehydrogenase [Sodiomyces alkalinus F11]
MAAEDYKFEGWLGKDFSCVDGKMVWEEFEPKPWEETNVDIRITHSGICGSDLHTLRSGWGPAPYPVCVGHEIVGVAVRVGSEASGDIRVGDRVGVGAQSDACFGRNAPDGNCDACSEGSVTYCPRIVTTYASTHFNGAKSMGGYATYHRCPSKFVVKVPDGLSSAAAAPMLYGGVTVYSPLRFHGAGPGKTVGIVGVGGLGHFGVLFAKALGADKVVGISRKAEKKQEVLDMGADEYIATDDDKDWEKTHANSIDIIISTVSSSKVPLQGYFRLLRRDGAFVQVGCPDISDPYSFHPGQLIFKRIKFTGSHIGTPDEIREMYELAASKSFKPWIQERPMGDANQAIVDVEAGKPRYRYVLVN